MARFIRWQHGSAGGDDAIERRNSHQAVRSDEWLRGGIGGVAGTKDLAGRAQLDKRASSNVRLSFELISREGVAVGQPIEAV